MTLDVYFDDEEFVLDNLDFDGALVIDSNYKNSSSFIHLISNEKTYYSIDQDVNSIIFIKRNSNLDSLITFDKPFFQSGDCLESSSDYKLEVNDGKIYFNDICLNDYINKK